MSRFTVALTHPPPATRMYTGTRRVTSLAALHLMPFLTGHVRHDLFTGTETHLRNHTNEIEQELKPRYAQQLTVSEHATLS